MDQDLSPESSNGGTYENKSSINATPAQPKRSRILLSCAPCRASKLKCDRLEPCSQCQKKGRLDLCVYAPRPQKTKPNKGMSARLKRLEGMVRGMMDAGGEMDSSEIARIMSETAKGKTAGVSGGRNDAAAAPAMKGQVVMSENATTYIGATHCMAMLEDIQDLKSYFEDEDAELGDAFSDEQQDLGSPDMVLYSRGGPRNREELIAQFPEKHVMDRIIMRYFASNSPSIHISHRPAFRRMYRQFLQDPHSVHLHTIAHLFMILSHGVFFNNLAAPHELQADSATDAMDRSRHYRSCATWALIWGKYTQPTMTTLYAFLLLVESHFLLSRATQMNCYILCAVLVRLMLKMGLHRDPDKLANITPFEAEMRRRVWNMALQIELLVSFHMGLPSVVQGLETDTGLPRHLEDDDFDEDTVVLPPGRPFSDYIAMSYAIHKTNIMRAFGQVARQAHSLTPPSFTEIMKIDRLVQNTWKSVPDFLKVRALEESAGDPPALVMQRFGLTALYQKSRCVLHRRFLAEAVPVPEHDYSRHECLEGAMELLEYQNIIWTACKPGNILNQHGYFVSSLAVHDFLLAAMVLYVILQNLDLTATDRDWKWMEHKGKTPTREQLIALIQRSHDIWVDIASDVTELRRTKDVLATMLVKLGVQQSPQGIPTTADTAASSDGSLGGMSSLGVSSLGGPLTYDSGSLSDPSMLGQDYGVLSVQDAMSFGPTDLQQPATSAPAEHGMDIGANAGNYPLDFDSSWITSGGSLDWRYFDVDLTQKIHSGNPEFVTALPAFMEREKLDDTGIMDTSGWLPQVGNSDGYHSNHST